MKPFGGMMMAIPNPMANYHLTVRDPDGKRKRFGAKRLEKVLRPLTSDPETINRAEILILTQLHNYKSIKRYDLKCLIYRTLKQLNYFKLAQEYHKTYLS